MLTRRPENDILRFAVADLVEWLSSIFYRNSKGDEWDEVMGEKKRCRERDVEKEGPVSQPTTRRTLEKLGNSGPRILIENAALRMACLVY